MLHAVMRTQKIEQAGLDKSTGECILALVKVGMDSFCMTGDAKGEMRRGLMSQSYQLYWAGAGRAGVQLWFSL